MGSFDRAEICKLVEFCNLKKLPHHFPPANVGLYTDDGLEALKGLTVRTADKMREKLIEIFKSFELKITVEPNQKNCQLP